jgi:hypothetical protein
MSQSTPDPRPPNRHHISFKWERIGTDAGRSWLAWLGIIISLLGIILMIAFEKGWF